MNKKLKAFQEDVSFLLHLVILMLAIKFQYADYIVWTIIAMTVLRFASVVYHQSVKVERNSK